MKESKARLNDSVLKNPQEVTTEKRVLTDCWFGIGLEGSQREIVNELFSHFLSDSYNS